MFSDLDTGIREDARGGGRGGKYIEIAVKEMKYGSTLGTRN